MNIFFTQAYIESGAYYNFSHKFQKKLSAEISSLAKCSELFVQTYGENFSLGFYISAKSSISENEIRGPTVFAETKDVEYTIFLPFLGDYLIDKAALRQVVLNLFHGVAKVLDRYEISIEGIEREMNRIIREVLSDPEMYSEDDW